MKSLLTLLLSIVILSSAFAQENKKNHYALSFGIADNFRLSNFNFDFAGKYVAEDYQIRLLFSPRIDNQDSDNENQDIKFAEAENNNYSIGVGSDYLLNLLAHNNINLYAGPGLMLTYATTDATNSSFNNLGITTTSTKVSNPSYTIGLRAILGVEWIVTNNIGIHSEYVLNGSYYWSKTETSNIISSNNVTSVNTNSRSGLKLNTYVLFGLSVYF